MTAVKKKTVPSRARSAKPAAPATTVNARDGHQAQSGLSVGTLIRNARKQQGLALRDVSEHTGLSISFLSQMERDVLAPSVSALKRIADRLGIPAGRLMFDAIERVGTPAVAVLRRGQRKHIVFPQSSIRYELLTPDLRRRASLLWLTAGPGADSGPPLSHHGEDGVVVLKGRLEVEVGGVSHDLGLGDSIYFNSELPHRWRNAAKTEVQAIWMSTPPSF